MDKDKLTTVDIRKLPREDLEQAYKNLLNVSEQKTELIKLMKFEFKIARAALRRLWNEL